MTTTTIEDVKRAIILQHDTAEDAIKICLENGYGWTERAEMYNAEKVALTRLWYGLNLGSELNDGLRRG